MIGIIDSSPKLKMNIDMSMKSGAMEAVIFSWLKYRGSDDALKVHEINSKLAAAGNVQALKDALNKQEQGNFNIMSKYIEELVPFKVTKTSQMLQLVFKEIRDDAHLEKELKIFRVVFFNQCAQDMHRAVSERRIQSGDIVTFHQPSVMLVANVNQLQEKEHGKLDNRLWVEVGAYTSQVVRVWQPWSNSYIDSSPTEHSFSYRYISIYDIDHTGSINHTVDNMRHILQNRGCIMPLRDIAVNKSPQTKIVLTWFKGAQAINKLTGEIKMFFEEILLEETNQTILTYLFPNFTAIFRSDLAKELQKAVDSRHIAPGDLVALCQPVFEKVPSAPIRIEFASHDRDNLIVLKCQFSNIAEGSNVTSFQLNISKCAQTNGTVSTCKGIQNLNGFRSIEILLYENVSETFTLKLILCEMKKIGKVVTLDNLYEQKKCTNNHNNDVVISYFLKLVSIQIVNGSKRSVLFLKEIYPNFKWGKYFRIVLHDRLAEEVCKALDNNTLISGDIVILVNPYIFHNPKKNQIKLYTLTDITTDEPYQLEIDANENKGRFIICKFNNSLCSRVNESCQRNFTKTNEKCKNKQKQKVINSINLKKGEIGTEINVLSEKQSHKRQKNHIDHLEHPKTVKNVNEINDDGIEFVTVECSESSSEEPEVRNINEQTLQCKEVCEQPSLLSYKNITQIQSMESTRKQDNMRKNNFQSTLGKFENSKLFPVAVIKPCLINAIDLVSGYCYQYCHRMFVYSVIVWSALKDPLCPKCLLELRLTLCIEMLALTQTGRHVTILLFDKEAEKVLGVECQEFLTNEEARKSGVEVLKDITKHDESKVQFSMSLSDVTILKLCI